MGCNKKFLKIVDKLIETVDDQNSIMSVVENSNLTGLIQQLKDEFKEAIESRILTIYSDIEVNTIYFPTEYIFYIYRYLIKESLALQNGHPMEIKIQSWKADNNLNISIEKNWDTFQSYDIANLFDKDFENIDDHFMMDLHMAKQQIQSFGGTYKILKKTDAGNIVHISLPTSN